VAAKFLESTVEKCDQALEGRYRFVPVAGVEIGPDTLLRWYVLHVLALPFVTVLFLAVHFWRIRKDGGISGPL
jgi:quinol-cytochrome oxidoreductase complex cytochrome b subunit